MPETQIVTGVGWDIEVCSYVLYMLYSTDMIGNVFLIHVLVVYIIQ